MGSFCNTIFIIVLCTISLLISACSQSTEPQSVTESQIDTDLNALVSTTKVSGNVIKGVIKHAEIQLYSVTNGVLPDAPFAVTTTDDDGYFALDIVHDQVSDLIILKAVGKSDGTTTMVCDAITCGDMNANQGIDSNQNGMIDFGETLILSDAFALYGMVYRYADSDTKSISITPLTNIAVQQAIKDNSLTAEKVAYYSGLLANVFNLPQAVAELTAMDITALDSLLANDSAELSGDSLIYSLYSSVFADLAAKNNISIEEALSTFSSDLIIDNNLFNRDTVLLYLDSVLNTAEHIAKQDASLQVLIADIRLLIHNYNCVEGNLSEQDCATLVVIEPPQLPEPAPEEENLALVKAFVGDFRLWVRDITLQAEPAYDAFEQRLSTMKGIWKNDLSKQTSALNTLLTGIASIVAPYNYSCYYCQPDYITPDQKRLYWSGLELNLFSDGKLLITGMLEDVYIDMDLQLPEFNAWRNDHTINVLAGRLDHRGTSMVLSEGSSIKATYNSNLTFEDWASDQLRNYSYLPQPESLVFDANFFLKSLYRELSRTFEDDLPLDGDWTIATDYASEGSKSLKSQNIYTGQRSVATIDVTTSGGYLTYDHRQWGYRSMTKVYVNGVEKSAFEGYRYDFVEESIYLEPGSHTITWEYTNEYSYGSGFARTSAEAWIDNISIPLANSVAEDTEFLTGQLSVSAEKLDTPWARAVAGYLPSNINLRAGFKDRSVNEQGELEASNEIVVNLVGTIANVADFVPPQPLDINTLNILGNYKIDNNLFVLTLPTQVTTIETVSSNYFLVKMYEPNQEQPYSEYYNYYSGLSLLEAAGKILGNSAIGWQVIVPEDGLYLTTLLGASPWGNYSDSQFKAGGGDIYGFLVDNYEPTETSDQYLAISAALELTAKLGDLPVTTIGASVSRDDLNNGDASLYVKFDGHRFNIDSNLLYTPVFYEQEEELLSDSPTLTITNQNGVVLEVQVQGLLDDTEGFVGSLIYADKVYANIERIKGLTIIRYIDGTGESLE